METQNKTHKELLRNNRIIAIMCVVCVVISLIVSVLTAYTFNLIDGIGAILTLIGIAFIVSLFIILGKTRGARSAIQNRG